MRVACKSCIPSGMSIRANGSPGVRHNEFVFASKRCEAAYTLLEMWVAPMPMKIQRERVAGGPAIARRQVEQVRARRAAGVCIFDLANS